MEWYLARPVRWTAEQAIARRVLRELDVGIDADGRAYVAGDLTVFTEHGHSLGPFRVRILYPKGFPERGRVPAVYLDSHRDRWRNIADSHIDADWKLCLHVPGESGIDFGLEHSLVELLQCLAAFLVRQHCFQQALTWQRMGGPTARWPGNQRSHGVAGIAEALYAHGRLGRNQPCICGSGKKFKRCCLLRIEKGHNYEVTDGERQ